MMKRPLSRAPGWLLFAVLLLILSAAGYAQSSAPGDPQPKAASEPAKPAAPQSQQAKAFMDI